MALAEPDGFGRAVAVAAASTFENSPVPVQVAGLTNVIAVSAGVWSTCAVVADRTSRTTWCWGYSGRGGLGNGALENSAIPVLVSGIDDATRVAFGGWRVRVTQRRSCVALGRQQLVRRWRAWRRHAGRRLDAS